MKNSLKLFALLFLAITLTTTACKKDEETEEELITTVVLHLVAADGSLDQKYEWNDLDGDGGTVPTIDNIMLNSGVTYSCSVEVYNRSETPEEDITEEINAESAEHLFVYIPDGVDVTVVAADMDSNGDPFRLMTTWTAGAASVGSMNILLKHEPDKGATDPNSTGETDFDVSFPVRIL